MNFSKFKTLSGLFFCIFLMYFTIHNFSHSPIQNRMPSSKQAEEMSDSKLKEALQNSLNQFKNQISVPIRNREGKLTGQFEAVTWDKATAEQVQDAFKQNVGVRHTLVSQARTFPSTHVGFALAIHIVTAAHCGGFNPFDMPIYKPHKPSSPSCGEDTLLGLLTDPLGIAGFYAFMVANAQTSGRLNNLHIKRIEKLGLQNGLSLNERKARVRKYIHKQGLSVKMMYGYIGMAVGSMTQDLLIDLAIQSSPCLSRFKLGLGLESTECKALKEYMLKSEKWHEFFGSVTNILSAAFMAYLAQTTMSKIFGPVLGKTMNLVGSKVALLGFTFTPGIGLKAIVSFGKAVAKTFSHAIYFVYFEELFRSTITTSWYNILHNKIYARSDIRAILKAIKDHQKNFWSSLQDEVSESTFINTLRDLNSQLKESQEKSHLRRLNEEKIPMFHRKASHLYAAYEGTSKLYSYVNGERSKGQTKLLEIKDDNFNVLMKILNALNISFANRATHNEKMKVAYTYKIQKEKLRQIKIWTDKINLLFNEDEKSFDLKGYFNLRRDFQKISQTPNPFFISNVVDDINEYWYEIDSFIEANITSEGILNKFYANTDEGASFYETLNQISYSDSEGERFFRGKAKTNTVFDWIVLKSICGDQNFSIKDEETYSIEFTPAGIIDRTKVDFDCKNPKNTFSLFQNKYKSDYFVDMDKIAQLISDFKNKVPKNHKDYNTLLEMIMDIQNHAKRLNDSAVASANGVSWFQVIRYTFKVKKLHRFINKKTSKEGIIHERGKLYSKNLNPSIVESTSFTFEVRSLITEYKKNESEHHATSKHVLYSTYSKENKPLIENEYSGLHFLLNSKLPLKSFVKSDLNIWWLQNIQKKAMQSHFNLVVQYKEMVEEEILKHNAVNLNDYTENEDLESSISKAARELLSKSFELKLFESIKSKKNPHLNLYLRTQFERYGDDLTSKSYDLQMLARSRFYLDIIKSLFSSLYKTNEEIMLEQTLNEQIKITLKNFSKLLVQLSYRSGEIKESRTFVEAMITKLNTAIIQNHKQFNYPNSYDSFVYYSDEHFNKANKDLINRISNIFEFEVGKPGAFVITDASGGGTEINLYRVALQRSIRDHYSLYIQNTLLIDDEKKVRFKKTLLATFQGIDSIEAIIKESGVENIDVFSELISFLTLNAIDISDFYNKYIEAFELLPQAGLAAISRF